MEELSKYIDGNTLVTLYTNGTKTMFTKDDKIKLDFPTNIDIKITDQCPFECTFCHEGSYSEGKHAPLSNFKFIRTLTPGTEVTLSGGAITTYPLLKQVLTKFKKQGVITNITVHIKEVVSHANMLAQLQEEQLIYSINVSMPPHQISIEEKKALAKLKNVVFCVINGIFDIGFFGELSAAVDEPELLILGYKDFKRGHQLYDKQGGLIQYRQEALRQNLQEITKFFKVIFFDDLALKQLRIKDQVPSEEWKLKDCGDEKSVTFYIDAVKGEFAKNSISEKRHRLTRNVKGMFKIAKRDK